MKKLVSAVLLTSGLLAFGDDVATLESNLKSDIMSKVNQVNPIDSTTGQRKYISFAMISDIHKCKRVPGDDATTNPVTTYWYGSAGYLTEAEQSIRLLGSLAVDAGLDAVINGGDLSTAPIVGNSGRLTVEEYTNEIWNVKAMFNQHLPASVPLFTVDGNHDRHYKTNNADIEMITSDSDWAYVLTNFNTSASVAHEHGVDVTYHRDLAKAKLGDNQTGRFTGNSYHLDFRRLYATKGYNVRIACISFYDTSAGSDTNYRAFDAGQFYDTDTGLPFDATKTPENTIMGMVSHDGQDLDSRKPKTTVGKFQCGYMNGYSYPATPSGPWNLGTHKGKAFFGLVAAHQHFAHVATITEAFDTQANPGNDVYASVVQVSSAYAVNYPSKPGQHQLGTDQAYHFSIFVVDTDNNKLHEVRVGGVNNANVHEVPVVQLYNTNIRTHLDQSAQTAPTLGTVTVTPAVTNATISGAISSLGSGATACDVYLAYGTSANNLGAATKIAEGATASFNYAISNLTATTTYYYSLSISNNAETVMGAAKSGNFTTGAEAVEPGPAHIHVWGDATYVWSAGNATCTGSAACTSDSTHVTNETVAATYDVIQAATTEAAGTGRYTAVFSGAPFETQTKDVTIPKLTPEPQPGEGILPGESASATRQTIQDAIDEAVPTQGTVSLANGLFEIDAQLMVTGGVTLVGQGWKNTTIKFAGTKAGSENRVVNISDGSVVSRVTLTGGKVDNNGNCGGGAFITDGTLSWCCVTNNYAKRNYGGGGVFVSGNGSVRIDHTIVAGNSAGTAFMDGAGGGICVRGYDGLRVEIDSCLVYGNAVGASGMTSNGGGIAIDARNANTDHITTVIRNTTVANNGVVGSGLGGGIYVAQADTTLINCIVSGNTSEAAATTSDADVAYKDATIASAVGTKTTTCLFGGTPLFVDAANGDYRLAENSPAIEAGTAYEGIGKDLADKYFSYTKPAIGCYEYGDYNPPPADEWDIPGTNGGIRGIDDGQGGKFIAFTAIAREGETVAVGFRAAEIGASVGSSFALICKDNLADTATFTIDATLTEVASPLGVLEAATDKAQIFVVGIGAADNN
ncbi:MAG: right-handed parallel beta-helix repeat-containing protein [Kiritimatiellae bacterium]|nr:right-handed parallel beta-helix repeat-containing protein [Kiritimatiellia bacterium]